MLSDSRAFPEWQEISVKLQSSEGIEIVFPAKKIVERLIAYSPDTKTRTSVISFDQIEIGLFPSTSYFSLIYNVRVTLAKHAEKDSKWFFIASFRGRREKDYLRSVEAKTQIANAIIECLHGIDQTGGFRP